MRGIHALEGGLAGAATLTLIHETLKKVTPDAPRVDLLGMNAIKKGLRYINAKTPEERALYRWTLAGDLISNALFYSVAGATTKVPPLLRGSLLGLAAGVGAILLPKPMGLKSSYSSVNPKRSLMTLGLYVAGGLVAAAVMTALDKRQKRQKDDWQERLVTSGQA
jgi:hypothetical protein